MLRALVLDLFRLLGFTVCAWAAIIAISIQPRETSILSYSTISWTAKITAIVASVLDNLVAGEFKGIEKFWSIGVSSGVQFSHILQLDAEQFLGTGNGRKVTVKFCGIKTASDVRRNRILMNSELGLVLNNKIMEWR
ncbi:hypothetical protein [Azospirillum sp. TSA6c]|uniref:hypothetical protein n=1 Tax=Azospirillum sp. TSA6c TaxID=709813 RepID=UPI0011B55303|nr:hypothetical protein [Azospirillum sp. TSA6c]